MNELKRIFFALAVAVSLGLIGTSSAIAQYTCTANSVPTLVRTQGLTEATGTVVLSTCTGPAAAVAAVPFSLTATIQPSSAIITNATTAGFIPTATLVTTPTNPAGLTTVATGAGGGVSGNTVTFNLTIPAGDALVSVTLGIVPGNVLTVPIRVNVSASGVVFPSQIASLLTSSPAGVLAITNNFLNVAIPQPGLGTGTFTAGAGIAQCLPRLLTAAPATVGFVANTGPGTLNFTSGTVGAPSSIATSTVREGFSTAFQIAGATGEGNDTTGPGTRGTRILFRIDGLQANVAVYAPQTLTPAVAAAGSATLTLTLVGGADASGDLGAPLVAPSAVTANRITTGTVTYQVMASSNAATENIVVPFGFFTIGTPSAGSATVNFALAAISTFGTPQPIATAPIPRFADDPRSGALVTVIGCVTNILFPFITNQQGFETGLAIANTTSDIFGTSSQSGSCVYNFFGQNAPSGGTFTTPAFAGGATDVRLLSAVAPAFQGYAIAQCSFQLGHGYFFVQNGFGSGTASIAQGGPALIIPQPLVSGVGLGTRVGFASIAPFAEALGH